MSLAHGACLRVCIPFVGALFVAGCATGEGDESGTATGTTNAEAGVEVGPYSWGNERDGFVEGGGGGPTFDDADDDSERIDDADASVDFDTGGTSPDTTPTFPDSGSPPDTPIVVFDSGTGFDSAPEFDSMPGFDCSPPPFDSMPAFDCSPPPFDSMPAFDSSPPPFDCSPSPFDAFPPPEDIGLVDDVGVIPAAASAHDEPPRLGGAP